MFESPRLAALEKRVRRTADAADTAFFEHEDNPDASPPWETLFDSKKGKFRRVQALFSVLRDAVPDPIFRRLTGDRYEYQRAALPVNPDRYEFDVRKIGNGEECNVYKLVSLDPEYPTLVIKIDNTTTQDADRLVARSKEIRGEYEEKRGWYRELSGLIPEELQFIGKSPRGGRNAVFTIQEYFGMADQIHDLFRGYSKEVLLKILRSDPELRVSFLAFVRITLDRAASHDEAVDTLGDKNVVLVDGEDGRRDLRLLDSHGVKHPDHPVNEDEGRRIHADLEFLREVSAALEREAAGAE